MSSSAAGPEVATGSRDAEKTPHRVLTRWRPGEGTAQEVAERLKGPLARYDVRLDPHENYLDVRIKIDAAGFHDARGAAWNVVEDAFREAGLTGGYLDPSDNGWMASELDAPM